ncbi:tripartite tricarboxylate transporter substrate binding protein [Bordetella bronchiseptica]|uniref:Tripartite tricarboxylate transporter family receptor n=1 Tax=Bordetella bronchiseptica 00-P-2796 TaxID=1331199 RepID=A0ABR4RLV8_BORBO|nr:tripartite tricarboxylate transporter substrate binding protein [Bordetella bronchiseptica]KAK53508.1 tripartite tricarboxylate transporter family receptor [Bordetella bronchiseptica OSU054]KCV38355.1 tripartite tricarboxylate transporter family receptor [Bordetella bronchiseptica 00-P-2796]KDB80064.1 tripartite tricarboxylate transporter family receptor [Bordetella bronchiseptica CA90 BB1334]KDC22242.1 tripartite tricarboxylate transporter family receptor [Bordetella bronchiseptica F-1]KDC
MTCILSRILAAAFLLIAATGAHAQQWPDKPIRIVVPLATGGIADLHARLIGQKLTERWGQPVLVENRPGAGGNIGAAAVAKAPADGYTFLMGFPGPNVVNQFLFEDMPYDSAKDFTPVVMVSQADGLLAVHPGVPIHSIADLLAQARENPGKLTYSSGGVGTASHLAGEMFKSMANVDIVHVPYKGNSPAVTDLVGGQVQMSFATLATIVPHVRSGKLRGIAVTGDQRSAATPELPTIDEAGVKGFSINNWVGLFAPAGTPDDIVLRMNAEVAKIMQAPEVTARLTPQGERFSPNSPAEFDRFVQEESRKWGKIIRDANLKAG